MWILRIIGALLVVTGGVWIAQGIGALHGSMMTGHPAYAVLGAATAAAGLALLALGRRRRG
jgi:MYXO-CTERM domain-containing protein